MAGSSDIEWTDATWNPVAGCTIVSPGCTNCYAMRMAARLELMGQPKYAGTTRRSGGRAVWTGRIALDEDALQAPLRWARPRRVFVNSMSDLFHEDVPAAFVAKVWRVMSATPRHTYQVLTKRPERMAAVLRGTRFPVLPNVWLGTSIENRGALHRLDALRRVGGAVRFVSFEPLLEDVGAPDLRGVHWAIVGGESGPKARSLDPAWVDAIRLGCERQGVAFFFKQWGGRNKKAAGRLLHGLTWDGFPTIAG